MAASSNCSPATGPFRATRIWNNLVQHLQENANVKRRRNVKKCYEECFTGANAVDVLHHFVRRNPEQFSNNTTIARENIVRLCQSFLDNQIFEQAGVGSNAEKNPKFDDSTSSLYQFTGKGRKESDVKSHNGRQVLRAIDGDIRNSLGHITISNEQNAMHETTLKSKNILIPTRKQGNRSHFPSFGGISAHSLKDTFMSSAHGSESEGESSDSRSGRPLKRSASFRFVTKRSSSESGVHQGLSSTSTCSDAEDVKEKKSDDINRGGKLRLSQRLSFRKKSVRRAEQSSLNGDHSCVIKNPVADRDSRCGSQNGKDTIHRKLTSQELSHLKRECVRVRLLQILDLQFVDGLITSPNYDKRASSSDFNGLFSSSSCASHGVQYSEVVSAYNSADSWISSALSVLQHLPNGYDILCRHARDQPYMKKIKLFFAISDYYKSLSKPLIDDSMKDIIKAIVQMLASKPADVALEALQLFMHLLTESLLYELRDLFAFLHYVITNKDVALTPQCSNKKIVIQTFPSAIFPTIAKDRQFPDFQSGICGLCYFIMDQRQQAFSLPPSVTSTMNRKRKLMEAGEVDSPSLVPDSTFCARISNTEYNKQRVDFTQMQVSELIKSLHTDTSMPPRKKKDLLKKMQSAHSSAFERSRGPMKVIHANPITAAETTPQVAHRKSVAKTPTSDPFNRKSNKSRKVYV
ncbi:DEP domain-containing protein 7-like isoform X2 [Clavelina lepadiformis]|uniref:DEP domain-containing protein 7-like isoform X2 n=1 Tax=Clavelina lepadiformis TaxID=159417 RepID=UPI00404190D6